MILLKSIEMSWSICPYLLLKFKKLVCGVFIPHYDLQILKVSLNLEILVYFAGETPWNTPHVPFLNNSTLLGVIGNYIYGLLKILI